MKLWNRQNLNNFYLHSFVNIRASFVFSLFSILLFSIGCNSSDPGIEDESQASEEKEELSIEDVEPVALTVSPQEISIAVGESIQLSALTEFAYGRVFDASEYIVWSASNQEIISLKDGPKIYGKKVGKALVTASLKELKTEVIVNVTEAKAAQLILLPEKVELELPVEAGKPVPKDIDLRAMLFFTDGSSEEKTAEVTWTVSDTENITQISEIPGRFQFKTPGEYEITAFSELTGEMKRKITVTQESIVLVSMRVLDEPIMLNQGLTQQLRLEGTYNDSSTAELTIDESFTITPANDNVKIENGILTALKQGEVEIEFEHEGIKVSTLAYIQASAITGLTLEPSGAILKKGRKTVFRVSANYTDGSVLGITPDAVFTNLSENIIDFNENTVEIEAKEEGQGSIKVEFDGHETTFDVLVQEAEIEKLSFYPPELEVVKGLETTFQVFGHYSDGSTQVLTEFVTLNVGVNGEITEIAATTKVKGKSKGKTVISANFLDVEAQKNYSAVLPFEVLPATVTSVEFAPADCTDYPQPAGDGDMPCYENPLGLPIGFLIFARYTDESYVNVSKIANVTMDLSAGFDYAADLNRSKSGTYSLSSRAVGSFQLVAELEGKFAKARVAVTPKELDTVIINRQGADTSGSVTKGGIMQFQATAYYTDGTSVNITDGNDVGDLNTITWGYDGTDAMSYSAPNREITTTIEESRNVSVSVTQTIPAGTYSAGKSVGPVGRSFTFSIYTPCTSPAVRFDLYCIAISNENESCNELCPRISKTYHAYATENYLGSIQNNESRCNQASRTNPFDAERNAYNNSVDATETLGLGCTIYKNNADIGLLDSDTATHGDAKAEHYMRICGCEG